MSWGQDKQTEYIQSLNEQLANSGGVGSRVFVVDTSEFAQTNSKYSFIKQINDTMRGENREEFYTSPENTDLQGSAYTLGKNGDIGIAQYANAEPADTENPYNPDDPNYTAAAFSAPFDETVNQSMHFFSRAVEGGADFSTTLSQEFTAKFTINHELGHTLLGVPSISDDRTYNTNFLERNGDAFASLKALQDASEDGTLDSTMQELEVMAQARDLRIGYAPDRSAAIHGMSHDTGSTIREVINQVKTGEISQEELAEMDLIELSETAESIATKTLPDYDLFQKMEVAQDIIRSEAGLGSIHPTLQEQRIEALPSTEGLDEIIVEMSAQFDAAHEKTPGLENSKNLFPDVQSAQEAMVRAGIEVPEQSPVDLKTEFSEVAGEAVPPEPENVYDLGDFTGPDAAYAGDPEMLAVVKGANLDYNPELDPQQPAPEIPDETPDTVPVRTAPQIMQP